MEFSSVSFLSVIFPIVFGSYWIKKLNQSFRLFWLILFIGFCIDLTVRVLVANKIKFIYLLNGYTIVETLLLLKFFFALSPFSSKKRIIPYLIVFFLALGFITFKGENGFTNFNSQFRSIECLMVIIFSGLLMIHESNTSIQPLFKNAVFCLASVLLIYFTISLSIFSVADLILTDHPTEVAQLWIIPLWLNLVCNLLFTYCFWCNSQATN